MTRSFVAALLSTLVFNGLSYAAELLPPASVRFSRDKIDESPDFRHHILPMMGRLGCNGRACHGSFQGAGGFRLSLFGYDAQMDHDALMKSKVARVDAKDPDHSLFITKPTETTDHEGGKRYAVGSWQYKMVRKWIADGAKPVPADGAKFERLEVTPQEIVFSKAGQTRQLKVVAVWSDGVQEDVTPLSRFRTNDEGMCKIDENGLATALGPGDTHVVAMYDNGVTPIPVMLPVSGQVGPKYPPVVTATKVDELIINKLKKLGITPSELCSDAEFLRRTSLDLTGTLPTSAEVEKFLNDQSSDKRAKLVDELLSRPGYAAWWATKMSDWTGNNQAQLAQQFQNLGIDPNAISAQWYYWIYQRLADNKPYDEIIAGILVSTSRTEGQSYEDYCKEFLKLAKADPQEFAKKESMPYFWMRQNFRKNEEMVVGFCYTFLGLSIQCAQCHKHPFDQWSKKDFDGFSGFFTKVGIGVAPNAFEEYVTVSKEANLANNLQNNDLRKKLAELVAEGKAIPQREVFVGLPPGSKPPRLPQGTSFRGGAGPVPVSAASATLLGGEKLDLAKINDPRQTLLDWMRLEPTRYFARSIVNRVWANYFNRGIIEPPDDMNLANPPCNAELLDYLTKSFVEHKYDLKWLHREIISSAAYQRSWKTNESNKLDQRNFSHAVPRRLPAEVAYDAIVQATAGPVEAETLRDKINDRAIGPYVGVTGQGKRAGSSYVMTVFGRPPRTNNCDCERNTDASLLQTIYLRNDQETLSMVDRATGWSKAMAKKPPEEIVTDAYLRALNRYPTSAEKEKVLEILKDGGPTGPRDLIWALVNTKEFIVNH